ncbi:MAG: FMN-binding negative transcriptional regulator, partial [Bacteroidota bacterium]
SNPSQASTWNYASVHAKGTIHFLEDEALEDMLQKTSLHFEKYNPDSATVFHNLDKDYVKRLMPAIVAFEVEVTKLDTIFKLSQDRDEASYENIMKELQAQDEDGQAVAKQMKERQAQVFPKG